MPTDPIELMSAYFTGVLDDAGQDRLEAWLLESQANADAFALFALEQHALEQVLSNEKYGDLADLTLRDFIIQGEEHELAQASDPTLTTVDLSSLADMEAGAAAAGPVSITNRILQEQLQQRRAQALRNRPTQGPAGPKVIVLPRLAVYGTIAAMVLFAVLLTLHWGPIKPAPAPTPPIAGEIELPSVATFETDHDALWAGPRLTPGQTLGQGDYQLLRGRATLRLHDGAVVVVESPARFTLDSTNSMTLDDGQLVAYCDVNARGFVVQTPYAEYVDLGTEFGVKVAAGSESQIHVFTGHVQARPVGASVQSATPISVTTAQAYVARVGMATLVPLAHADEDLFLTTRRVQVLLWNTGQALDGQSRVDPHWVVTQIDGSVLPQPIQVVGHRSMDLDPTRTSSSYRTNRPGHVTWVLPDPQFDDAQKDSYTYETRFELGDDLDLSTLVLDLGFVADNYVSEIRFNGQRISVPEHRRGVPYLDLHHVWVDRGFVAGVNRLEIVINNVPNASVRANRTALMAELQLTGQQSWKSAPPNAQTIP